MQPPIDSLIGDPAVDAVDVCLPTFLHEQSVVKAARAGKHVLCEKPVALSLEQVDRMIEAVETAGVAAMVGQVIRFWPEYMRIRELLAAGELGRPRAVSALRLSPPPAWGNWFLDPNLSGGAILDLHIHDLDFVYALLGMPRAVYALGVQSATGAWDHINTSLDYGDAHAAVEASFLMPQGFPFQMLFRILGTQAAAEYRFRVAGQVGERAVADKELMLYPAGGPAQPLASSGKDAYVAEIDYFVDCLADQRAPTVATLRQARDVLSMALAARQSLETGQVVQLQ